MQTTLTWIGIAICLSQSAMFSGLNLAFFSLSRLRLEIESENDNRSAVKVLALRKDANFLLTTILWGNVGANVLLTLLCDSVMAGLLAFLFSSVFITIFGEIAPQAFFSRHALKMASRLAPMLYFYQFFLYPVARPSAYLLDKWLGKEGIIYWREQNLKQFIKKHIESASSDVSHLEGVGAINFLTIDDLPASEEGQNINPNSIIALPEHDGKLLLPNIQKNTSDAFIQKIHASKQAWAVLTNENGQPRLLLETDHFLRDALFEADLIDPYQYCHTPIIVEDGSEPLWKSIVRLKSQTPIHSDEPISKDVILVWSSSTKKVITGADILGRLLKGVA